MLFFTALRSCKFVRSGNRKQKRNTDFCGKGTREAHYGFGKHNGKSAHAGHHSN